MDNHRIENKENVHFNGKKTSFKIYVKDERASAFIYSGNYFANGWNATDEECVSCYQEENDDE